MAREPVTRLHINGKEIILVGTAHVSQESVALVREVIAAERPDSVCIELDDKRFETIKNPKAWEETDIVQVVKSKRAGFMLANLALGSYQRKIAKRLGTQVGGEMLQGIKSADEVGAQLVLADRDIQTTFLRIWRKLNLWEKCKLLTSLFISFDDDDEVGEADLKELLETDLLESVLHDMRKSFPKIGDILIGERDQYLSHQIKNAPGDKVVAILGGAHVPGILQEIHREVDIEAITQLPPKGKMGSVVSWAIPLAIIGLLIYAFVGSVQTGLHQLSAWVLWTGCLAALFTILSFGHPLTVLTSFVVAPFSTLNPLLAVGWISGLVQAWVKKPTVSDLQSIHDDILNPRRFFRNKFLRVLLVVMLSNIGASIGTFIAGADLIRNLF